MIDEKGLDVFLAELEERAARDPLFALKFPRPLGVPEALYRKRRTGDENRQRVLHLPGSGI